MALLPTDEGLRLTELDTDVEPVDEDDASLDPDAPDRELETLRDEFVDGFNARDLDALLSLVSADVECPDLNGDGAALFSEELDDVWARWPGAVLTRGFLDGAPVAVAWLPDEDGCWARAALVILDGQDGLISLVTMPEDADALDRAEAEDPSGDEVEEWADWAGWESGAETVPHERA